MVSPITRVINKVPMFCLICGKPAGTCNCWTTCQDCGRLFETDKSCNTPQCIIDNTVNKLTEGSTEKLVNSLTKLLPALKLCREKVKSVVNKEIRELLTTVYDAELDVLKERLVNLNQKSRDKKIVKIQRKVKGRQRVSQVKPKRSIK